MNTSIPLLFFGLIAFVCALLLYVEYRERLKSLEARTKRLEEANTKRINYTSLAEIENAMAELVVYKMGLENKMERIDSAIAHLSRAHTPRGKT